MLPNERTTRNEASAAPGEIEGLVVSPDRQSAKPLADFLRAEGAHVEVVCSVETAVEEALLHRPHIILIDERISRASGVDLCERLKANARTHFLPAVLWLHQRHGETVRLDALSAGADAVFIPSTSHEERRVRLWALLRSNTLFRQLDRKRHGQTNVIREKRRWIRRLIHDIQNSLGAIQANFEYLAQSQGGKARPADLEECVQDTRGSFRELVRSLRTVLEFERFEAGDVVLRESPVLLSEIIEGAKNGIAPTLSLGTKEILVDAGAYSQPFTGDPNYLKEALSNLVLFILRQSENRTCKVSLANEGARCRISVHGDVFRIPAEGRDQLFNAYTDRKKSAFPVVGHGVGLPLAKVIVELHGGTLEINDPPASGSGFVVNFPAVWPPSSRSSKE